MSVATKDNAWISTQNLVRFDCFKCGSYFTSSWSMNERDIAEMIREHAQKKHGGVWQ